MDRPKLLLATGNQHKLSEMRALLGDIPFDLVSLRDINLDLEVEEPFDTYIQNAKQKAYAYADASGLLSLADDSGLEIDAFGGEPGVFSARFLGVDTPYTERFAIIEQRLAGVAWDDRTARFRCVMALATPAPDRVTRTVEGVVEGMIAREPSGAAGFGYDPIFLLPDRGVTMAEISAEEKDAISHRGRAARAMAQILHIWPHS